jgi:hypothetical protein
MGLFKKKEIDFTKETEEVEQKSYLMLQALPTIGAGKAKGFITSGIKGKVKDWIKRGLTNEQIVQPYKNSPNCVELFKQIGMSFEEVEGILNELRDKKSKVSV